MLNIKNSTLFIILLFSTNVFAGTPAYISFIPIKPWAYLQDDNEINGIGANFTQLLQKELQRNNVDLPITVNLKPLLRIINDIKSGETDFCVFPANSENLQFKGYATSLGKVFDLHMLLVSLPGTKQITSFEDLDNKRIAMTIGSIFTPEFDNYKGYTRININDIQQGLKLLTNHRIDILAASEHAISQALEAMQMNINDITIIKVVGKFQNDLFISKSSKYIDKSKKITAALDALRDKEHFNDLFHIKYNLVKK